MTYSALSSLSIVVQKYDVKISAAKTKLLAFLKEPVRSGVVINGKCIEQINAFRYLGTEISYLGEVDIDEKVVREIRLKVYLTFAMLMLTYGCKVWILRKRDNQRMTAIEMNSRLYVA